MLFLELRNFFFDKLKKSSNFAVVKASKIMTLYPNAKINIGLFVTRKRPDGYHDIESFFLPVRELTDVLEVERSDVFSFSGQGIAVDCPAEQNLVVRTWRAMQQRYGLEGGVKVRLEKRIPFGAGLGGGSADAAFMAKAVNELFDLGLSSAELEDTVAPLGSDCPFFIENRPRFAEGTGNIFSDVPSSLTDSLSGKWLVLVKPDCAVSTAAAYRGIVPEERHLTDEYFAGGIAALTNDFERTVFPLFPEIESVKEELLSLGASYAAMSGSGATVFGIFSDRQCVSDVFPHCFVHEERIR